MNTEFERRLDLLTARMTLREPFIAAVYTKLPRVIGEEGTASTNGKQVYFGEPFCSALDDEELLFVKLHEASHVVFMHPWRRGDRNPMLWNIATDAVINRILKDMGYKPTAGAILFPWVQSTDSAEEVYKKLLEEHSSDAAGGSGGFDGTGDLEDATDAADAADIEATIMTAARMAKACGAKGAMLDRILGGELAPTVRWTDVLRYVMTSASRDDYSFRRFNRRYLASGLYLPSLFSDSMGGLVVGVDTSASIGARELDQIAAEVTAIAEDCRPDFVEVVYIDTSIKKVERFEQDETISMHPVGGGGTRFAPLFQYVAEKDERVAAVVYLTDLEGNLNECSDPGVPVIWASTNKRSIDVPFGSMVSVAV